MASLSAVLAWARSQPADSPAQALAAAYLSGTLRVSVQGRTVEYRSLNDIQRALETFYAATAAPGAAPRVTIARVGSGH